MDGRRHEVWTGDASQNRESNRRAHMEIAGDAIFNTFYPSNSHSSTLNPWLPKTSQPALQKNLSSST